MENTIVAISTAMGNGGIGIVRMSGEKSFEILEKIFRPKNKDAFIKGYQIKYGNIVDPRNEEIIDEVLVSYFVAPKSYTLRICVRLILTEVWLLKKGYWSFVWKMVLRLLALVNLLKGHF